MRRALPLMWALPAWCMSPGCATPEFAVQDPICRSAAAEAPSPYLLFDRHPGPTNAAGVPPRVAWPTVEVGTQVREAVQFQEYFIDRQGGARRGYDTYYRRFTTRRAGIVAR